MKAEKRIEYVDIFRGIGIIFMLMGHIGFGVPFNKFIYAFHMPMFFFISGMFYRELKNDTSIKEYIFQQSNTLLRPYITFGVFHYVIWVLFLSKNGNIYSPLSHLIFMNTDCLPIAVALWFLTALFGCKIIYHLLASFVYNDLVRNVTVFVIAMFGCFFQKMTSCALPWAMEAAFVGVGLYHLGRITMKFSKELLSVKSIKKLLLVGGGTTVLIFINNTINMRLSAYEHVPLFWLNAVVITIIGLNLARLWSESSLKKRWGRVDEHLRFIARNAIIYVCLNHLTIRVSKVCLSKFMHLGYFSDFLVLLFVMVQLYLLSMIMMKTKLRVIVGR